MTGGHTVAGVINWDYLALKVNIFVYIYTIHYSQHKILALENWNIFSHCQKNTKKKQLLKTALFSD